jgi:serine/threonine protein kinase
MTRSSSNISDDDQIEVSEESSELRDAIDEVLRGVAHAPPCAPPIEPTSGSRWGDQGRFVIERRIGRGGMGTVYLATDSLLGRQVALKVLDAGDQPESEARRKRLLREARLAAGVEHERIARVYDVGEHDETTFVAMEYVRGANLRAWMKHSHDPDEILGVVEQIADGLVVLHRAGVIHRDLKPENVMLPDSGGVKLLDFGLAGQMTHVPDAGGGAVGPGSASVSAFQGTPGYIAPEQYSGSHADSRADVFALGVIVFELVTGGRPFPATSGTALVETLRAEPVRCAGDAWQHYPAGLGDVTKRMLEVDRDARFADGAEVRDALRSLRAQGMTLAPPYATTRRRRSWRAWFVVAVTGLVILVDGSELRSPRHSNVLGEAPAGMVLIAEGELAVGQSSKVVADQCQQIGAKCTADPTDHEALEAQKNLRRVLGYQVPQIRVNVEPFYLDIHEVTNREMVEVLNGANSSLTVEADDTTREPRYVRFQTGAGPTDPFLLDLDPAMSGIEMTPEHRFRVRTGRDRWPVIQATWSGAQFYCKAQGKRLPTENEWEAAARGSDNRPFPWGSEAPRCRGVNIPNDAYVSVPGCPDTAGPADVMSSPQDVTPQGVYDMGGNAAEWVETAFAEAGRDREGVSEPSSPHVIRGGSWFYSFPVHTSVRNKRPGNTAHKNVGFRCATNSR